MAKRPAKSRRIPIDLTPVPRRAAWPLLVWSRRVHGALLPAAGAGAGVACWLVDDIWTNVGFGLPIVGALAMLLIGGLRFWPRALLRHANGWAGLVALGFVAWGALSFYDAGSGPLRDVGLGGEFGRKIIGDRDAAGMWRLAGYGVAGLAFLAPTGAWRLVASIATATGRITTDVVITYASALGSMGQRAADAVSRWSQRRREAMARRTYVTAAVDEASAPPWLEPEPPPPTLEPPPAPIEAVALEEPEEEPASVDDLPKPEMAPEKEPVAPVPAVPAASPPASTSALAGSIMLEAAADAGGWRLPSLDILDHAPASVPSQIDNEARARLLEQSLSSYGIDASVVEINPGPAVTQFGVEPGWVRRFKEVRVRDADGKQVLDERGKPVVRREEVSRTRVKVDAIANLDKDLAMAMAAPSIRIEAPVPGKSMVGIEVPNATSEVVSLRSILESPTFAKLRAKSKLAMALGKGSGGDPVVADLATMPHLLIAGATGSGKSVCINAVLVCILMQATPQEVRLLLIDPKRVEMAAFNSVPHLAAPVIVDVEKVVGALKWAIQEMEERYKRFAKVGARNLESYNSNQRVVEPLPYLVIAVDELADLMMAAPYDIEHSLTRLAQLGRATGIHLVVATQRPSVDVVTGLIKANFPTRISFAVASLVDSRTILDSAGAEKLLGRGDMLYLPQDAPKPTRIQGVFVSDREIERVVRAWNSQTSVRPPARMTMEEQSLSKPAGRPVESAAIVPPPAEEPAAVPEAPALTEDLPTAPEPGENDDPLLVQAREMAQQNTRLSPSLLSRRLKIGYTKAKRLMEELEAEGQIDQEQELAR